MQHLGHTSTCTVNHWFADDGFAKINEMEKADAFADHEHFVAVFALLQVGATEKRCITLKYI